MKNKKNQIIFIIILLLLALIGTGIYFLTSKNGDDKKEENNTISKAKEEEVEETIQVEAGEKFVWETERLEFTLPKGWTYRSAMDDDYNEIYNISGNDLNLTLEFMTVAPGSLWSQQENKIYNNSQSVLYEENDIYKAITNSSITTMIENHETGETSSVEKGLFLTI